jgi:hypothetical protein
VRTLRRCCAREGRRPNHPRWGEAFANPFLIHECSRHAECGRAYLMGAGPAMIFRICEWGENLGMAVDLRGLCTLFTSGFGLRQTSANYGSAAVALVLPSQTFDGGSATLAHTPKLGGESGTVSLRWGGGRELFRGLTGPKSTRMPPTPFGNDISREFETHSRMPPCH